jgi:hypothetical protein
VVGYWEIMSIFATDKQNRQIVKNVFQLAQFCPNMCTNDQNFKWTKLCFARSTRMNLYNLIPVELAGSYVAFPANTL